MATDFQAPPPAPAAPAAPAKNTMSVVGLIFAFLVPPLGLILSIVGLVKANTVRVGKGLAIAGIIIGLLGSAAGVAVGVAVFVVADKVSTALDPGCTDGKDAVNAGNAAVTAAAGDPAALKTAVQKTIGDLDAAAAKAEDTKVRDAMKQLADDYRKLVEGLDSGNVPADADATEQADIDRINELCALGSN